MNATIVVPFNPGNPERDRLWLWVRARYQHFHPEWEVIEGRCHGEQWSKGRAVADGARRATTEALIVADADSWVPAEGLRKAVNLLDRAPWVVPHSKVHRLSPHLTESVLAREPVDEVPVARRSLARQAYSGPPGGGIVVLTRTTLETAGPPDPRFNGWGGEDISWAKALNTLAGSFTRLRYPLFHLWHEPQPTYRKALPASEALAGRYLEASGKPAKMRALLEEVTPWPSPA